MSQAAQPHLLSKTRVVSGFHCQNKLWWEVHEPGAPELQTTAGLRDRLDQGKEVEEHARECFPAGALIGSPHQELAARVAETAAAINDGAACLFDTSFLADDVIVASDVLLRDPGGLTLIEVKSSTAVKDAHIIDVGLQLYVARASGVDIRRAEIMHLNPDYRHPGIGALFVREDVTAQVLGILDTIRDAVARQKEVLSGPFPDLPVGEQCANVDDCLFRPRCWPQDPDHVLRLNGVRVRKKLEWMASGIGRIQDLPAGTKLSAVNRRQKEAVERNGLVIEPSLGEALRSLQHPVGFLDFETVARAIPVWNGLAPWGKVPVQFSYHEERDDGEYVHVAWLADGPGDPREGVARSLVDACANAGSIVCYGSFERQQIRHLTQAVPQLSGALEDVEGRLFDLQAAIKDAMYHPAFAGSFSIKNVLPAMLPDLSYDDLTIADGETATAEIARLLLRSESMSVGEREQLRRDLLAYCERDTLAMVKLTENLRVLV